MNKFYAWITAMLPSYTDNVIYELIKLGYSVGAANPNYLIMGEKNAPSCVICLCITGNKNETIKDAHDDLVSVFNNLKYICYSIVVIKATDSTDTIWSSLSAPLQPANEIVKEKIYN